MIKNEIYFLSVFLEHNGTKSYSNEQCDKQVWSKVIKK